MNDTMQRHLGNISRQVGHDVSNRYSYIVSSEDLTNAYLQMRDELGYPLMVDSRNRRAIVYNKKGLEKRIEQMIGDCIVANVKQMEEAVVEDIMNDLVMEINGLTQTVKGGGVIRKNKGLNMVTSAIIKGLVNGVSKIIDDISSRKDK